MSYGNFSGGNDYSNNAYGGGGGGGGGGYLSQGVAGSQASPSSAAKDRKSSIRPVTIKQILECELQHQFNDRAPPKIDGIEVGHVTIVARVRSVTDQTLNITYVVDDGTAQCNVKQWIEVEGADGSAQLTAQSYQGKYVRIIGQLVVFGSKLSVSSHAVRPVENYNEVQYHLLEATAMHLYFTRGPPPKTDGEGGYAGGVKQDTAMSGMEAVKHEESAKLPMGTSGAARVVWETIRAQSAENNEGMHVQVISQRSNLALQEVMKAVDELMHLGVAYTTLDDEHINVMDF